MKLELPSFKELIPDFVIEILKLFKSSVEVEFLNSLFKVTEGIIKTYAYDDLNDS